MTKRERLYHKRKVKCYRYNSFEASSYDMFNHDVKDTFVMLIPTGVYRNKDGSLPELRPQNDEPENQWPYFSKEQREHLKSIGQLIEL